MGFEDLNLYQLRYIFILFFILIKQINGNGQQQSFNFSRTLTCLLEDQKGCLKWEEDAHIQFIQQFTLFQCFSENVQVLTSEGPLPMKQLTTNSYILGYNFQNSSTTYTRMIAWLHRDTDAIIEHTRFHTDSGYNYFASPGHNIAYNNNGSIGFKFADQMHVGDQLFSIGQNQQIQEIDTQFMKGLYSPYTQNMNFFVLPAQYGDDPPLILVSCLSLMQLPQTSKEHWFHFLITSVFQFLHLNQHNNEVVESYLHPSSYILHLFQQKKPIRIKHTYTSGQNDNKIVRARKILSAVLQVISMQQPIMIY